MPHKDVRSTKITIATYHYCFWIALHVSTGPAKPRVQSTNVKSPWLAAMVHNGWRCCEINATIRFNKSAANGVGKEQFSHTDQRRRAIAC